MCGINGFTFADKVVGEKMNAAIRHRGPDDQCVKVFSNLTLAQVRLSILDVSVAGQQPMMFEHKGRKVWITFNGEIYNYLELRDELIKKGYVFQNKTDTEVILASYLEWGQDCVSKFNGMWAFVIYDSSKEELFCSRDRLGQKPFYYYHKDGEFIFSSELKGLLANKKIPTLNTSKNINPEAVDLYFSLGFIPAPYTIYGDTFKLNAGHNLIYSLVSKTFSKKPYFTVSSLKLVSKSEFFSKKSARSKTKALFKNAVQIRMRSDVPVGAFLSGGVDSSAVVSEMSEHTDIAKLHTFSVGFEAPFDETKFINIIQKKVGTNHHHHYYEKRNFTKDVLADTHVKLFDEPFSDYSSFPANFISHRAKKPVTVCLSGDGGDELFAGYANHTNAQKLDYIAKWPYFIRFIGLKIANALKLKMVSQALRVVERGPKSYYLFAQEDMLFKPQIYISWIKDTMGAITKKTTGFAQAIRLQDLFFMTLGEKYLTKVDRTSMHNGLEVRSPFLDYRFIEHTLSIKPSCLNNGFTSKKYLKDLFKDKIPAAVLYRKKQGFTPPIAVWLFENTSFLGDLKLRLAYYQKSLFSEELSSHMLRMFDLDTAISRRQILNFYFFDVWYRGYVA